jgi:hypothetical protein
MAKLANSLAFVANAQATVVWGRELTDSEKTALANAKISIIQNGAQCDVGNLDSETLTSTVLFSTTAAADSYAAVAQGFSPAPTSATVQAV